MNMIKVAAGIIVQENKILITRRASKEAFAGGWEFPGGKIEPSETPQECLKRELKEELGIDVTIQDYIVENCHDYGDFQILLLTYLCKILPGKIKISVHDKIAWVSIDELEQYNLLPADVPIAHHLKNNWNQIQ